MAFEGSLDSLSLLDLVQIMAYSERSGCLFLEPSPGDPEPFGTIVFERGNIIVVHSPASKDLLVRVSQETSSDAHLSLRRAHALASLRDLFDIQAGHYRFVESTKPMAHIEGIDLAGYYQEGALDTGDLLVVLAKTMDAEHPSRRDTDADSDISLGRSAHRGDYAHHREFERCGPVVIRAASRLGDEAANGYLTNLSLGGVFFHGEGPIPLGSEVELSFELPWELGSCRAHCTVTWGRSDGPPAQRGSGMRFDELIADTEDKLTKYLQRFARMAQRVGV